MKVYIVNDTCDEPVLRGGLPRSLGAAINFACDIGIPDFSREIEISKAIATADLLAALDGPTWYLYPKEQRCCYAVCSYKVEVVPTRFGHESLRRSPTLQLFRSSSGSTIR